MFICEECGYRSVKWLGKCLGCGSWESFVEEIKVDKKVEHEKLTPKAVREIEISSNHRFKSGIAELDRVLGGGLTKGSVVLFSGAPGIGKSTILLQAMSKYAANSNAIYVSGEESEEQIKSRAVRVGIEDLKVISSTNIDAILNACKDASVVAIDSIQTMGNSDISGSISQIRESISKIINLAKTKGISFIVIGHVNKEGKIAGPKMLEHMVDTVVELEGDRDLQYRILRTVKNRFGSINEVGVFKMTSSGMEEVTNPSELFISNSTSEPGSIIAPIIEGNRVFLVEIQSLVSPASLGIPRRISQGMDSSFVQILSAVCEKSLNLNLSSRDIYFNIPGGIKTKDTSIGLALILSIYSSYNNRPIDVAAVGEVGLTGELRKVSFLDLRVKELARLGFKKIVVPNKIPVGKGVELIVIKNIKEIPGLLSD